jgi:hypothetical protein
MEGLMTKSAAQRMDPENQISRLERKRSGLKLRVAELERRAILTPREQIEVLHLKKEKLALKDSIEEIRRSSVA